MVLLFPDWYRANTQVPTCRAQGLADSGLLFHGNQGHQNSRTLLLGIKDRSEAAVFCHVAYSSSKRRPIALQQASTMRFYPIFLVGFASMISGSLAWTATFYQADGCVAKAKRVSFGGNARFRILFAFESYLIYCEGEHIAAMCKHRNNAPHLLSPGAGKLPPH